MKQVFSSRRRFSKKWVVLAVVIAFLAPIAARAVMFATDGKPRGWHWADWSSTGSLPAAREHPAARVLVLSGQTGGWRGVFSVHSWIVLKRENVQAWTRYDVVGWGSPVRTNGWAPDGLWYGNRPVVVADLRGAEAEALIPKIEATVKDYRWRNAGDYRIWPGPNSNTFVASVLRAAPEIGVMLPSNAIGRDFRPQVYAGPSDSRTGLELNIWGVIGMKLGWVEGVEVNILGLVAGLDLRHPALKLPGYGRIGPDALAISATAQQSRP